MKKYIILLFTLILSLPLLSQLEVKEGSFKEVPGFININTEKMYDDNDKPYAVLKIKTENISSKERHELSFKGDAQTFFEVEYKDGEVWLYISYYATYIKISHEEFSSTEFHFPFDMKPKCGYELTLIKNFIWNNKKVSVITDNDREFAIRIADYYEELYVNNQYVGLYPLDEKTAYDLNLSCNYEDSINSYRIKALEGDPVAQNNYGACYYKGHGIEKNYENAAKWFKASAEQGNAIGQINLAICCFNGNGVEKDSLASLKYCQAAINQGIAGAENFYGSAFCSNYEERFIWWEKSAAKHCAIAQFNMAGYFANKENFSESLKWLWKASEQGLSMAMYQLGLCYYNGQGVSENKTEAWKWIVQAANKNFVMAEYAVGYNYYLGGDMVAQDFAEAFKWFKKAAEKDDTASQFYLGTCYEYGRGVDNNNYEAYKWYYKAAVANFPTAQSKVGLCYFYGLGVTNNYQEAIKWFKKAAENNDDFGQYAMGLCYYNGYGVSLNYNEAFKWFELSAKQNNPDAMIMIGYMYNNAQSVKKDKKKAFSYYLQSANLGNATAQNNVGICYETGTGVSKNIQEAINWYKKSAEQGNDDARSSLRRLGVY